MAAARRDALDLRIDFATRIMGGQRDSVRIKISWFAQKRQIAAAVRLGRADEGDVNLDRFVAQIIASVESDMLDKILGRHGVAASTIKRRISKRAEADVCDQAGASRANLAQKARDHAARKGICSDFVIRCQFLHGGRPTPMPANHTPYHAFMR